MKFRKQEKFLSMIFLLIVWDFNNNKYEIFYMNCINIMAKLKIKPSRIVQFSLCYILII